MIRKLVLSSLSLAVVFFLLASPQSAGQTLAWAARDGGMLTDPSTELGAGPGQAFQSQSMVVDALGNAYVIGTVQGGGLCSIPPRAPMGYTRASTRRM